MWFAPRCTAPARNLTTSLCGFLPQALLLGPSGLLELTAAEKDACRRAAAQKTWPGGGVLGIPLAEGAQPLADPARP